MVLKVTTPFYLFFFAFFGPFFRPFVTQNARKVPQSVGQLEGLLVRVEVCPVPLSVSLGNLQSDRWTEDRWTEGQADRRTDGHTDRQTFEVSNGIFIKFPVAWHLALYS